MNSRTISSLVGIVLMMAIQPRLHGQQTEAPRSRKEKLSGDEAKKWKLFVELRRPKQMRKWAEKAGLSNFHVAGRGAICADDPDVGQGVWLWFTKGE